MLNGPSKPEINNDYAASQVLAEMIKKNGGKDLTKQDFETQLNKGGYSTSAKTLMEQTYDRADTANNKPGDTKKDHNVSSADIQKIQSEMRKNAKGGDAIGGQMISMQG